MAQEEARAGRSWFGVVPDEDTIHEDFFDSRGKSGWISVGGAVDYRVGIKENQIGVRAYANRAAIFPAEALSRQRCHFTNRLGQREPVSFAHVYAKDARKCAGAAGMAGADAAITGDHNPGLLIKRLDV